MKKSNCRNKWVLCVPKEEREKMLIEFHDRWLHPGINKMRKMMSNLLTWVGMSSTIKEYVNSCHKCQVNKFKSYRFSGPLQSIIPRDVGELVAIDIFEPLVKSVCGYTCILVIVDIFSKYTKLYGLKRSTAISCLKQLNKYMLECGKPQRVLSDNGPQFSSRKWRNQLYDWGIKETHTAVRHPKGNPCERYVRIVGECLRLASQSQHSSWAKYLRSVENFININYNETTAELPV